MIVVYILLLLVSLLFYIQYEGAFSFYLFCFVAAYPVVFGILTYIARKNLNVGFETAEKSAPKGSSVPINIIIDNDSFLPIPNCDITVKYKTDLGTQADVFKIHTPVFPNNSQVLTVRLSYKHYGTLNVEIAKVRIFDILRIIKLRVKTKGSISNTKIVVFPDHIPIDNKINDYSELGIESESYSKEKKGDDPSEIFDIHAYNEGDKISRIHWKLSAKQDDLMVKDYSMPITNGVMLAIDLSSVGSGMSDLDRTDAMIDAIAAISLHLAEHEMTHTLLWCTHNANGYERIVVSDFESYTTAIKMLISDGFKMMIDSPADVISELGTGSAKFAHVIYCTNALTESTKTTLTESGYAYRYTVLDTAAEADQGYTDGGFVYIPLRANSIAESLENIAI